MKFILWAIGTLGVAAVALYMALRTAHRRLPPIVLPPGETMPVTVLERLATRTLAIVVLLSVAAATVVVWNGAEAFWTDDGVRLLATALTLAALAVFAFYLGRIGLWTVRDDGALDERDRAILAGAPAGQAPAMIVTLAAWMIGLTETFLATHLVPTVFLYLMFWSCLMVSVVALLAGVVLGYRRH